MKTYAVTLSEIQYPTRKAENVTISTQAENAESAQENVIELLESLNACHGSILSIRKIQSIPESGTFPV